MHTSLDAMAIMMTDTMCYMADVGAGLGRHVVDVNANIMCTLIREIANIVCTMVKEVAVGAIVCTLIKEIGSSTRCLMEKIAELFKSRPEVVKECMKLPMSPMIY